MRLHCLQHTSAGALGTIDTWCYSHRIEKTTTRFFAHDALPTQCDFDILVILGGPMHVNDTARYPWLTEEIAFIRRVIDAGKNVLGICLGAQLIARALGAPVTKNTEPEIGWHPLYKTTEAKQSPFAPLFPERLFAFQWHEDTFALPKGAIHILTNDACTMQAFSYRDHVLGVQAHLEVTPESVSIFLHKHHANMQSGRFIQSVPEILRFRKEYDHTEALTRTILDSFVARTTVA